MKVFIVYILSISFLSLISCRHNKRPDLEEINGKLYRDEYYANGVLKSRTPFINDSVYDGTQVSFYPNGKPKSRLNWVKGKQIGESLEYYENGKLKDYEFYNLDSKVVYERNYDTTGKMMMDKGEIFPVSITDVSKFNQDKVLKADIYVMHPPNTDISLKLFLINKADTVEVPYKMENLIIHVNEEIKSIRPFTEFAIKQIIRDFDQSKQWEQTNILDLSPN